IESFLKYVYDELSSANLFSRKTVNIALYEHLVGKYINTEYVRKRQGYKLALIRVQEMAMSSPSALRLHLKGKLPEIQTDWEKNTIQELLDQTEALIQRGKTAKMQALLRVTNELMDKKEKLIVFSRFRGTIEFLREELEKNAVPCFTYTGDLSAQARGSDRTSERSRRLNEFKDSEWSVLISTDTGAEGLNLQFCGVVVNFDLPWNPMLVEQRIGRIHRLGQERPNVFVYNLAVKDSVEDNIVLRLYERLKLFELAIGELDEVLSRVAEEESIEEVLQDHILAVLTKKTEAEKEAEREKLEAKLKEALEEAQADKQFTSILGPINID
ncbi:MAG: box helicase, partial [Candidatus Dadabacteria bacterium]|nr:box helicase [Candidatus Dadabacteria bacterium]